MMFEIRKIQEQVLFNAIKSASNDENATRIIYGEHEEDDATWVKSTMTRLENCFDGSSVKQIRMNCQCGYGMDEKLELVKELVAASSSMGEFGSLEKANAAGMFCTEGELYLQFPFCPCPMLADVDKLDTCAWCQCTTGYSKVLFEEAFGCEVDVELLKSVKMGDGICLMKIIPLGTIWK
ncbi:hypothetical protein ASZ90_017189 [hydrocarbon metagenome]|uniref:Metanogen output domain-containing protein n=1 Tax=hydrocarbon metagenome TaxID=938273 RepID=A0A0W8E9Z8_9ZZZZ